jgi:hypothetical protein
MDFFKIKEKSTKEGVVEVYPDFVVTRSQDLMVRAKDFYAIWDEKAGLWSTETFDVQRLVDEELWAHREKILPRHHGTVRVSSMLDFSSGKWQQFLNYMKSLPSTSVQLDEKLTFANTEVKKSDYVSKRLPYSLEDGDISAWDELVSTLYDPEEREKIEWTIGAIVSGDSKHIQKFLVFYGTQGSGKSTIINIIQDLFTGYTMSFDAKALTSNNNAFGLEMFKNAPLVAIQHDGDLSKIEDNTKFNSLISHESMLVNEKFKPQYESAFHAFPILGTNSAVKITDAKSGIIRRLIDVNPSGRKLAPRRYQAITGQVKFELGAIAQHCLNVYRERGKDFYEEYRAIEMMLQTDVFYNYIEYYYDVFKSSEGITLNQAYEMYRQFCDESGIDFRVPRYKFREELRNYFSEFEERAMIDGVRVRSWYTGFKTDKFRSRVEADPEPVFSLVLDQTESIFDQEMVDMPAQYSTADGVPTQKWDNVTTKLTEIDTSKEHYVKVPENHIVLDFDLKDENGEKSAELNLLEASKYPPTYAEFSKSGGGIHLHYNWHGDVSQLSRVISDGIEVKVFTGNSSLRRRLSYCNNIPVTTIDSGLPLREKKVINTEQVKNEEHLRRMIEKNLKKEIHPGTKSSVDFIYKLLDEAHESGLTYDVSDMRGAITTFAANSTNQSLASIKTVNRMKFKSEDKVVVFQNPGPKKDDPLVFFDVEVYPNLFVICWKYEDSDTFVHMVNPKPHEVENLMRMKLVGFNCRRYDNHIIYAASMGADNAQLYRLSKKIIDKVPNSMFGVAYNISYTDIYDFTSLKQSLKKYEVDLGLKHQEMDLSWDEPVPEELWEKVIGYCDNDVAATEATFKARKADFLARQILAELSGLTPNDTTQNHTAQIVFQGERNPQRDFPQVDLKDEFPGYTFDHGKSDYRGENPGEGGYVYAEPGMHTNVVLLDVESMHPSTIEILNHFGPYTKNFSDIKAARVAIKNKDFDKARKMLGGKLAPYLVDETAAKELSYALKIAINIVYGLTSASFKNAFKADWNKDNIIAKRGALFMIDLKHEVQARGFTVAHIKTDSIKIPNATPEIIQFVMDFGAKYGYKFVHEATYEKMALVNDAVYVAKYGWAEDERLIGKWTATGAQFQHPYVYKSLFSHEPIEFRDLCEAKSVQSALYLDFTEGDEASQDKGDLKFIGKTGLFTPIMEGKGGGLLLREKDDKFYAATGSKGYRWMESHTVQDSHKEHDIDDTYFRELVDEALANLAKHGDVEWFLS